MRLLGKLKYRTRYGQNVLKPVAYTHLYLGEGEVEYDHIMEMYKEHKKNGGTRDEFLRKLLSVNGMYVPKFYDVTYKENGEIASFGPNVPEAPATIKKVIVTDMDSVYYPPKMIVPLIETVHDRVTLELFRGCIRGCRFCQAGFVYRPCLLYTSCSGSGL